jgi:hypothetical protein
MLDEIKLRIGPAGLKEAVIKFVKVIFYVGFSGALVAIGAYVQNIQIDRTNIYAVAIVGGANAIIALLQKWLSTKEEIPIG